MARNYIKIDTTISTATHAGRLKRLTDLLREVYGLTVELQSIMDHNQDGVIYTDLEALFGLPTGKGDDVFVMLSDALSTFDGNLQSNAAKNLMERVG